MRQSSNVDAMEDILQLWEFGKWARNCREIPSLAMPSWVREIKSGEDREKSLDKYIGDIDTEYALVLDSRIAALDDDYKNVLYLYYVKRKPWRMLARILNKSVATTRENRATAVGILYGMLKSS